ncbi:amidohydrolase family protein [Virgibacillus sp. YIM 98842]|uniref:amidohydrolase family protein n=1 Tax=Virgibacillus sp. YIM 98842 TaxID=2663533 RepID=UPI001F099F80|nr:amidohydrolase family protein [Virgibacillus sp. YIM 98842]
MGKKMKKCLHMFTVFILLISLGISDIQYVSAETESFDTIIRNGSIIDGSGLERYDADIAIKDGYIAEIGDLTDAAAEQEINAEGNFVAPGFIDVHSHASLSALREAESPLSQGVTMEVLSPDGGGPVDLQSRIDLEDGGLGINIGSYIGFNSVWSQVVGNEDRRATDDEIEEMQQLISEAMEKGAAGVSAGLFYRPAYFAETDQVIDVVSAASEWRTNFPNHQRNENNEVVEATAETIEIGEESGLAPVITHIKTMGPNNWGKSEEMMQLINDANERGVYTAADIYPYLRSQTGLTAIVPPWAEEGGRSAMLERFRDPELRDVIEEEIEEIMYSRVQGPEGVYFPTKRMTLADYMDTGVGNPRSRTLLSFLNLNYEQEFDVDIDEITVTNANGNVVYEEDFEGADGDGWDRSKFDLLHSYPSTEASHTINDNAGHVNLAPRISGNASAYSNVVPGMPDVGDSETFMRFKVGDTMGANQIIRVWINSDNFGSGSSFAMNGFGVAVRLDRDRIQVYERENSSSTIHETISNAGLEPDTWQDLKVKLENDTLLVKMWPSDEEEPEEWDSSIDVSKEEVVEDQKAMVSVTNLDADSNTFHFDDFRVESASGEEVYYEYDFEGNNGDGWHSNKFINIHSFPENDVDFSIQENAGVVTLAGYDADLCCSTYGKFTPDMDDVKNSDVLLRFKADEIGGDQQLRIFTKSDEIKSGMTLPANGFGLEIDFEDNKMSFINREESTTTVLDTADANLDTDWHTLRLHAEDDEVSARIWKDGEEEPEEWDFTYVEEERELTIGETTMQILETEGSLRTIYDFGHEDDFRRFIQSPVVAIASDGGASTSNEVHPRRYGTQPRVLGHYVREEGLLTWEEAVQKMTSFPAALIGLSDRGYIARGMKADITIFDPDTVIDHATFEQPRQFADGIEHVFVNGELALNNGELTGIQVGEFVPVEPNMPTRPVTQDESVETSESREILSLDGSDIESSISFNLEQGESDFEAAGSMTFVHDDMELVADKFGRVQAFDGWISFTGAGTINGEMFTTFRVTVDENDPTIDDDKPVVTINIAGQEQIQGYMGEEVSEPSEPISIEEIKLLIQEFRDEEKIADDETSRVLQTHLTAVEQYEENAEWDKAVRHMNSFKDELLAHYTENELISEEAAAVLVSHGESLIAYWEKQ